MTKSSLLGLLAFVFPSVEASARSGFGEDVFRAPSRSALFLPERFGPYHGNTECLEKTASENFDVKSLWEWEDEREEEGQQEQEQELGHEHEDAHDTHLPWAVSVQAGYAAETGIGDVILGSAPRHRGDVYLGFSLQHRFSPFSFLGTRFRFEGELNPVLVLESARDKRPYAQANLFLGVRYLGDDFPWRDRLRTSIAIGEGASYSWRIPDVELVKNGADDAGRLLNYLVLEVAVREPDSRWSLFARLSHRSGGSGRLSPDGVSKGSNLILLGIRYAFGG